MKRYWKDIEKNWKNIEKILKRYWRDIEKILKRIEEILKRHWKYIWKDIEKISKRYYWKDIENLLKIHWKYIENILIVSKWWVVQNPTPSHFYSSAFVSIAWPTSHLLCFFWSADFKNFFLCICLKNSQGHLLSFNLIGGVPMGPFQKAFA